MNVRATAIVLTLLAHLLVLLLFNIKRRLPQTEELKLQFVSVWPESPPPPVQPQPVAPPRRQSRPETPIPHATALAVAPLEPAATLIPVPTLQTDSPNPPTRAPVDWITEGQKAAAAFALKQNSPVEFSPPPDPNLPARLCTPRKLGKEMQAKMEELLDLPPDIPSFSRVPQGSVMMPGGIRVGIIGFGVSVGKTAEQRDLRELMNKRPDSSVPDPHTCE